MLQQNSENTRKESVEFSFYLDASGQPKIDVRNFGVFARSTPRGTWKLERPGVGESRRPKSYAASIESHSDHLLAHAITTHARQRDIAVREPRDLQTVQGKGVTARVDGRAYWLGSHRYLKERGQETPM